MAWSLVAHAAAASSDGKVATIAAINTSGADLLVAIVSNFTANAFTVSDSKSNSWTGLTSYQSGISPRCQILWSRPTSVGSGHTVTADSGANNTFISILVLAFSGSNSTPTDVENGAADGSNSNSTIATGSVTPSQPNSLIVAAFSVNGGTPSSINSGFTLVDTVATTANAEGGASAYLAQGAVAAVNPTWTNSIVQTLAAAIAVFKPFSTPSTSRMFSVF